MVYKNLTGDYYSGPIVDYEAFGVVVDGVQVHVDDLDVGITIVCQSNFFGGLNVQNILRFRQFRLSLIDGYRR